jgi:hypothetical protein
MNATVKTGPGLSVGLAALLLTSLCLLIPVAAQESRGSVSGRVTDPSGAAAAGARVTITNTATSTATTVTAGEDGNYTVPFLQPGIYEVAVEAVGFKRAVRQRVEVRVGDKLALDVTLEVGGLQDTVNVTGDSTPVLDAHTATLGQVVDRRRISELPLLDGNPVMLTNLAPGINHLGDRSGSIPPSENGDISEFRANGSTDGNVFTLDGAPNNGIRKRIAYVPPADAVQEFKVTTASFDAQQGRTSGATVDVALRSGGNDFHGSLYEFIRNDALNANNFFANARGQERAARRYHRFGGVFGGPVILPTFGEGGRALWNGRERTFFFASYEQIIDRQPVFGLRTVPSQRIRDSLKSGAGADLREYITLYGARGTVYDPLTARRSGARTVRDPIQCNGVVNVICANRLSPIALKYIDIFYPLPNRPADADGRNNYQVNTVGSTDYDSLAFRVDHNYNAANKGFFRYALSHSFILNPQNWQGVLNGLRPTGGTTDRTSLNLTYDHVTTISPTTFLNLRAGYVLFTNLDASTTTGIFDPRTLGFSEQTAALFGDGKYLPPFNLNGTYTDPLSNRGAGERSRPQIASFLGTLTKVTGGHSLRFGYEFHTYIENGVLPRWTAGSYNFGTDYTRQTDQTATASPFGQDFAALLLGQPTGGLISNNSGRSNLYRYQAPFVQDDWKVTRRLTLNLGLRYDYEPAPTERYDRNINGFDPNLASPIAAAAQAAYAKNPVAEIPAANFRVRGGVVYPTKDQRGFYEADKNNFQPRLGFAYQVNEKTLLRGGFGVYTVPVSEYGYVAGYNQLGFSLDTLLIAGNSDATRIGLNDPQYGTLFNPFPNGIQQPLGAGLGLSNGLGRALSPSETNVTTSFFIPEQATNGQTRRWTFGAQRELPGQWLVDVNYVGTRSRDLPVARNLNAVPRQYLSTAAARDNDKIAFLTSTVANPFAGLIPGTNFNNATIAREQLLKPYPQFGDIWYLFPEGRSWHDAATVRVERRFAKGYTFQAAYTWAKFFEATGLLNQTDERPEKTIARSDVPHTLALSGIAELPFGRGRRFGANWHWAANALLGGWELTGWYKYRTGNPLNWGNVYYNGDPYRLRATISNATLDNALDRSGFYFTDAAVQRGGAVDPTLQRSDPRINLDRNLRTFPSRLPGVRNSSSGILNLGLLKDFAFGERVKLQLRGELSNAFNTPVFGPPNLNPRGSDFGRTLAAFEEREAQIGIKLIF